MKKVDQPTLTPAPLVAPSMLIAKFFFFCSRLSSNTLTRRHSFLTQAQKNKSTKYLPTSFCRKEESIVVGVAAASDDDNTSFIGSHSIMAFLLKIDLVSG